MVPNPRIYIAPSTSTPALLSALSLHYIPKEHRNTLITNNGLTKVTSVEALLKKIQLQWTDHNVDESVGEKKVGHKTSKNTLKKALISYELAHNQ